VAHCDRNRCWATVAVANDGPRSLRWEDRTTSNTNPSSRRDLQLLRCESHVGQERSQCFAMSFCHVVAKVSCRSTVSQQLSITGEK